MSEMPVALWQQGSRQSTKCACQGFRALLPEAIAQCGSQQDAVDLKRRHDALLP